MRHFNGTVSFAKARSPFHFPQALRLHGEKISHDFVET